MTTNQAREDLQAYQHLMGQPGREGELLAIEMKHGLDGLPPQAVTEELALLASLRDKALEQAGRPLPEPATTRLQHLAWCRSRAIAELEANGPEAAIASMMSDLTKWEGGDLYEPQLIGFLFGAVRSPVTVAGTLSWINGFS